jgi:hypothetical protein
VFLPTNIERKKFKRKKTKAADKKVTMEIHSLITSDFVPYETRKN